MNPDPFSMRELVWMMEGKTTNDWNHTAALITNLRQCFGDKKAKFEAIHPDTAGGIQRQRLGDLIRRQKAAQSNRESKQ